MSGLAHWLPSHDSLTGTFALLAWAVGVVTALVFVLGAAALREDGMRGTLEVYLRGAVVVIIAALAWAWLDFSVTREQSAERRALDARAAELASRAIAPGSALACLDAVDNEAVESACLQAVFASPQAVAAAVGYIDARLTLLADGLDYASRDKTYATEIDRQRRALENDRYGVVAHVLAGRGCNAEDCAAFKMLRDPSRVRTNLTDQYFEAHVVRRAASWQSENATSAAAAAAPATPPAPATTSALPANAVPFASKYNFPSASSIPPVSIMTPEPTGPPTASSNAAATPPAQETAKPPARKPPANKPATARAAPLPPPPAVPPSAASNAPPRTQ